MNEYTNYEQAVLKSMQHAAQDDGQPLDDGRLYYFGFTRDIKVKGLNRHQIGGVIGNLSAKGLVSVDDNKDTSYAPDPHPGPIYELFLEINK